jgi:hypothetical protein
MRCRKDWPSIKETLRANTDIAITLFRKEAWK